MDRIDVTVCHSSWSQAIFGPAARAAGVPLVFWLHDAVTGRTWLERWASQTSPDLAVCNSRFTAETLPQLFPSCSRAEVVYAPFLAAGVEDRERVRRDVRAELDTPAESIVDIQVSRMEAWKGHAMHLEALGRLKEIPDWTCWMVGGSQRPAEVTHFDQMKRLANDLGIADRVRFLGSRADVPRLLVSADIHCQPNRTPEPFGLTFVEAMSAGLPVVTTGLGGAAEIVTQACGVLVPSGDTDALALRLGELIGDANLRSALGTNGPARVRDLCDPSKQMHLLQLALTQVVAERAACG